MGAARRHRRCRLPNAARHVENIVLGRDRHPVIGRRRLETGSAASGTHLMVSGHIDRPAD
eukprot:5546269-Prymnesium_polylepis.1